MPLRTLARRAACHLRGPTQYALTLRRWQSGPTVWDKLVDITVFDAAGKRHVLRGKEGDSLVELLAAHEDDLGGSGVVGLSPDGRGVMEAVVTIPNQYLSQVPAPMEEDMRALEQLSATGTNISGNARLASKIILSRALNDVHIALHGLQPWKTL